MVKSAKGDVWPIDRLKAYDRNARTHSAEQIDQLAASIEQFGMVGAIVARDGVIAKGHGTLAAVRKLYAEGKRLYPPPGEAEGAEPFPAGTVPVFDTSGWTDTQFRAFVIADNRLALDAGWNEDLLTDELVALLGDGFDLTLLGFGDDELAKLLDNDEATAGLTDEDSIPALPIEPVTVPGDVWLLGKHRVMCGDSTSVDAFAVLMKGAKADFCFTSPPYNSAMTGGGRFGKNEGKGFYADGYSDNRSSEEYVDFNRQIVATLAVVAAENFTCCYNLNYNKNSPSEYIDVVHAMKSCIPLVETIVWEKHMAVSLQGDNLTRTYEFVFVLCKGKFKINKNRTECLRNLWKISNVGANTDTHKACFPVALVEEGIRNFCPHGGRIVEPFGGSGSSVIAAENLGCTSYTMEIDPKYVDVIVKRWQDFTGKAASLEATGQTFEDVAAGRMPETSPQK
ncbi:MAG TPA: DNA methyltransferase [Pseudolabrys sp.]|jgi:DNA modification methylase|nr:DNA methyltransferase [Pseudolabrys sp.]